MFFIDALLSCFGLVVVSKGLQGEVLEKLEELIIILRGRYLGYSLIEEIDNGNI